MQIYRHHDRTGRGRKITLFFCVVKVDFLDLLANDLFSLRFCDDDDRTWEPSLREAISMASHVSYGVILKP